MVNVFFFTVGLGPLKAIIFSCLAHSIETVKEDNFLFFVCYRSGYYAVLNF